jgi:hypothetical protein
MKLFRTLFAFDALALLSLLYFFADGLRYATPGSAYMETWIPILLVPAAVLALAWMLKRQGKLGAAKVLLGVLAVPFVLYGLFVLLFVVLSPDMR